MRILFMGTPEFAVPTLQRILDCSTHQVVGVLTQPDRPVGRSEKPVAPPVKQLALKHGLAVHSPEKIKTEAVGDLIAHLAPEIIVVVAYGKILPPWILEAASRGAVNVHASLLPKYRGAAPIQWAIVEGETVTGVTTMKMDAGLDTGDILLQREVAILPQDDAQSMHDKLSVVGADLLLETLEEMSKGTLSPRKQDEGRATRAPILKKEDGRIDWSRTATTIHNRVRGLNPWPGTYTMFRKKMLRIWKTAVVASGRESTGTPTKSLPGEIVLAPASTLSVICGNESQLSLLEVQPEGHRRMPAIDFVNGYRIKTGERMGREI